MSRFRIVSIDGGAASGKTSTARGVAGRLNFLHVDTGTHYRALTLACQREQLPPSEGEALRQFLSGLELSTRIEGREGRVAVNGHVPPEADLRGPAVTERVSAYAALPMVRQRVMQYQRAQAAVAAQAGFAGLVMDGRDIGTVIFPEADLKIFLTADEQTRAQRRQAEGRQEAISERDRQDSSRTTAPLRAAADAIVLDNSALTLEQAVHEVVRRVQELAP